VILVSCPGLCLCIRVWSWSWSTIPAGDGVLMPSVLLLLPTTAYINVRVQRYLRVGEQGRITGHHGIQHSTVNHSASSSVLCRALDAVQVHLQYHDAQHVAEDHSPVAPSTYALLW